MSANLCLRSLWRMKALALPLIVGACLAGCTTPSANQMEAARQQLLETDKAFSSASQAKGMAQAFYDYTAPDGISLPSGDAPIKGRDGIRAHLAAGPEGVLSWTPLKADVAASGDLGYTWGAYEFRPINPAQGSQPHYGKYVSVWKKQPDGSWKVVLDAGNPSPPPAKSTTN
jgi:ketosteroid isomerase-like protein